MTKEIPLAGSRKKKTVLVTGASSGIGYAIVQQLLDADSSVIAVGRSEDRLLKLSSILTPNSTAFKADLTDNDQLMLLLQQLPRNIDGFVHAAGIESLVPLRNITYRKFDSLMKIHVYSYIEIVKHIANHKPKESESPTSIVAISSVASDSGGKGQSMYAASKAALEAVSRVLSKELSDKNIRINVIRPGLVDTAMTRRWAEHIGITNMNIVKNLQLRGLLTPEEVANLAVFLLSEKANGITGSQIIVDAGGARNTYF